MYYYESYLTHHGIKGQKWGVRRYQYADGSLTPAGRRHLNNMKIQSDPNASRLKKAVANYKDYGVEKRNNRKTSKTGDQLSDTYINKNTDLARIQTKKDFENFAFYATYEKNDQDKYEGLFGSNLRTRANRDALKKEQIAQKSNNEADIFDAKNAREYSDNLKVYQLKLESTKKLKFPSDENAANITANLLKEKDFRENMTASLEYSKTQMLRPSQQMLFNQAQKALKNDPSKMTEREKISVYKAFNLSLTFHNPQDVAAQERFYNELKKKGYDALLDYNDKHYSSYHANRPTIVFNTDTIRLKSVTETNPKVVDELYKKYNKERIRKEMAYNTTKLIEQIGNDAYTNAEAYVKRKTNSYMNS